jgi:hypothetical protein
MKLHYLLIAALLLSPGALAFSTGGAEAWFVSLKESGTEGRAYEDHTSSSMFFPAGTTNAQYKIRANYPLNDDPANNYVLIILATSNSNSGTLTYQCEGMESAQTRTITDTSLHGRSYDDMEDVGEVPTGLGGALRIPKIGNTTYGLMLSPQNHPLQPLGTFNQYTNSAKESTTLNWWTTCNVSTVGGDVWLTGVVLRDKTSVLERHFATLNHEFNIITSRTYQTIDMLDDILYAIIIVIGVILVIFIFVFIWKTFEYFINMSRRP